MNLDKLKAQVRALLDRDQRTEAIQLVCQITGWGLKESKDYVDALARAASPALGPADEAEIEQKVKVLVEQDRYAEATEALFREHTWSWLGEEGKRIGEILAGIDPDDEMALLDRWEEYLRQHIQCPFDARVAEFQERGPLQAGDRVSVQRVFDVDDHYGVIVLLRHRRKQYHFPLCDLEPTDEMSPDYQIVRDYAIWFANR